MPMIGVAVPVPEPWGGDLQRYRTALGDPAAALIPTHVTLVPPVEVAPGRVDEVIDHLTDAAASSAPFRIVLSGTDTFRPVSPVVFVSLVEGMTACRDLAAALRAGPLAMELEFPYHAHVTVAQLLPDDALDRALRELADFGGTFDVASFHLYAHDEATGWTPRRAFPLG